MLINPWTAETKKGGKPINQNLANQLQSTIDGCNLLDMGFQGSRFTLTNGCTGTVNSCERIDRAWCNVLFTQQFDRTVLKHLIRTAFDHHPLLLGEPQTTTSTIFTGFRFLEVWFRHLEFGKKVEEFWTSEPNTLCETMANFKNGLTMYFGEKNAARLASKEYRKPLHSISVPLWSSLKRNFSRNSTKSSRKKNYTRDSKPESNG